MRVYNIQNISFKSGVNKNNTKPNMPTQDKQKNIVRLGVGVTSSVLLGTAAYFVFRKSPSDSVKTLENDILQLVEPSISNLKTEVKDLSSKFVQKLHNGDLKVQYSSPVQENENFIRDIFIFDKDGKLYKRLVTKFNAKSQVKTHDFYKGAASSLLSYPSDIPSECLVKKVKISPFENIDDYVENGQFKQIIVSEYNSGKKKVLAAYYTPNLKIHELNIFEKNMNTSKTENYSQYNFAFNDDGKYAGYSKRVVISGGNKNDSHLIIKMLDGKNNNSDTIEKLYDEDPRFNPKNF